MQLREYKIDEYLKTKFRQISVKIWTIANVILVDILYNFIFILRSGNLTCTRDRNKFVVI